MESDDENYDFADIKSSVRSCLFAVDSSCSEKQLRHDFYDLHGSQLDDELQSKLKMTFAQFMRKIPDVCRVTSHDGELTIHLVKGEKSAHLDVLKRGERKKSKNKARIAPLQPKKKVKIAPQPTKSNRGAIVQAFFNSVRRARLIASKAQRKPAAPVSTRMNLKDCSKVIKDILKLRDGRCKLSALQVEFKNKTGSCIDEISTQCGLKSTINMLKCFDGVRVITGGSDGDIVEMLQPPQHVRVQPVVKIHPVVTVQPVARPSVMIDFLKPHALKIEKGKRWLQSILRSKNDGRRWRAKDLSEEFSRKHAVSLTAFAYSCNCTLLAFLGLMKDVCDVELKGDDIVITTKSPDYSVRVPTPLPRRPPATEFIDDINSEMPYPLLSHLKAKKFLKVRLFKVESPSDFVVRLEDEYHRLAEKLNSYMFQCRLPSLSKVEVGNTVAVRLRKDGMSYWYRGEVLLNEGPRDVVVKLVDNQTIIIVDLDTLYPLPSFIAVRTRKAVKAKLSLRLEPEDALWPRRIVSIFKRLLNENDNVAMAEFVGDSSSTNENCFQVVLTVDHERVDVGLELKKLFF